jgi:hypothetical protein
MSYPDILNLYAETTRDSVMLMPVNFETPAE